MKNSDKVYPVYLVIPTKIGFDDPPPQIGNEI